MKIYTKTGDAGQTGLFAGPRVAKDDPRIEAYGGVDELNAALGWARCQELPSQINELLHRIQNELFVAGAELATPDAARRDVPRISPQHVKQLEAAIDHYEDALPPLKQFILPGGAPAAAALHLARTICRRAERHVVALAAIPEEAVSQTLLAYVNRLSDLLFVLARAANAQAGRDDTPWKKPE